MSLTWQGLDLQPAHRRWRFWIAQGRDELPDVRTSSDLIPFRRGRLHRPGVADRRPLELRGYIQEASLAAFRAQHDTLKGLLDPETEEPGTLADTFEDGGVRWVRAVPRNLVSKYGGDATRVLSIELEALYPFWYGSNGVITLDSGLLLDSGYAMDQDAKIVITPMTPAYNFTFNALGTTAITDVIVEVDGPSDDRVFIYNESLSPVVGFGYDVVLGAAETLVVDSGARSVRLGSVNARGSLLLGYPGNRHGEYLRLRPGSNTIRINGKPAQVRISFPATYL